VRSDFAWGDRLPTIAASRVSLRALESRDVPALFAIFSDPQVMRYWSSPPLADIAAATALLHEIQEFWRAKTLFQWGVARNADDVVVGTCTLFHLVDEHRRAELGFALGRSHWGSGLMSEALGVLIAFAFEKLDLHRLEADADPRNTRSIRCLEGQGFRREGYLRERYHVGGEIQDTVYFGLLRHEWPNAGRNE